VFWLFRGEGSQLLVDARKAGEAAGDAGAKSFSDRYGASLKKAVGGAVGSVAGLAFGSLVNGSVALDAATRQLQADTGMTADEADRAQKSLAGMYSRNLQGFDEIGRAMASVHNDLGLTGDAADATTQKFLKLTEVTGGDTAEAIGQADDVLDAFNLDATRSGELLDKLTVSHQRYGGSISGSLDALASLGPALNAANMGLDDGIALLNLFNAAGIDASKAPQALNKALAQVKSPEELRRLIADITATADPFLRAQKASELFGTKAGPQLAQALAQGNLDEFTVSMDDAAGATEAAAAAIEDSLGNKAKLALKEFGGTLAEVGTNLGDLLTVAALIGPSLTSKVSAAVGGLAGILASS
jgi:phage-related minor tail protein